MQNGLPFVDYNMRYLLGVRHGKVTFVGPFEHDGFSSQWLNKKILPGDCFLGETVSVEDGILPASHFETLRSSDPSHKFCIIHRRNISAKYCLYGPYLHITDAQNKVSLMTAMRGYSSHVIVVSIDDVHAWPVVLSPGD